MVCPAISTLCLAFGGEYGEELSELARDAEQRRVTPPCTYPRLSSLFVNPSGVKPSGFLQNPKLIRDLLDPTRLSDLFDFVRHPSNFLHNVFARTRGMSEITMYPNSFR